MIVPGPAADVEQVEPGPQRGQQVAGGVLGGPPAVRLEHRLGVAVGVRVHEDSPSPPSRSMEQLSRRVGSVSGRAVRRLSRSDPAPGAGDAGTDLHVAAAHLPRTTRADVRRAEPRRPRPHRRGDRPRRRRPRRGRAGPGPARPRHQRARRRPARALLPRRSGCSWRPAPGGGATRSAGAWPTPCARVLPPRRLAVRLPHGGRRALLRRLRGLDRPRDATSCFLHLQPGTAPEVFARLVSALDGYGVGFRAELAGDPAACARADTAVVTVDRGRRLGPRPPRPARARADAVRPRAPVPAFTRRLGTGHRPGRRAGAGHAPSAGTAAGWSRPVWSRPAPGAGPRAAAGRRPGDARARPASTPPALHLNPGSREVDLRR